MRVKDLVKLLQEFDPNAEVMIYSEEKEDDIIFEKQFVCCSEGEDVVYFDSTFYVLEEEDAKNSRIKSFLKYIT